MATLSKAANANSVVSSPGWTTPENAYADDGTVAAYTGANGTTWSNDYKFPDFGTGDIPDSSTINSVKVSTNQWQSSSSRGTSGVQGIKNGSVSGSEATSTSTSTSNVITATLVGVTLSDLRSASTILAARVRCTRSASQAFTGSLDYCYITVDYSPPSQGITLGLLDGARAIYAPTLAQVQPPQTITVPLIDAVPASGTQYRDEVLSDSPVAYWRLGEPSGNPQDSAGTNHVTVVGGSPTYGQTGALTGGGDENKAVAFATSSDYFTAPDATALDLGDGPFSIEFWFNRITDTGATAVLIDKGSTAYIVDILGATDDYICLDKGGLSGMIVRSNAAITAGSGWHHVVITRSGSGAGNTKIYVDGVEGHTDSQPATTLADNSAALCIGKELTSTNPCGGALDEVALYKTVLTADRVTAHYSIGKHGGGIYAYDDMNDTVADGWGSADEGGTWSASRIGTQKTLTKSKGSGLGSVGLTNDTCFQEGWTFGLNSGPDILNGVASISWEASFLTGGNQNEVIYWVRIRDYELWLCPQNYYDACDLRVYKDGVGSIAALEMLGVSGSASGVAQILVDGSTVKVRPSWNGDPTDISGSWDKSWTDPSPSSTPVKPHIDVMVTNSVQDTTTASVKRLSWADITALTALRIFEPTLTQPGGIKTITAPLIDGLGAIYAPSIQPDQSITAPLIDASRAIYAPSVQPDQTLTPGLIDGARAAYAPTIRGLNTLTVALLDGVRAIYAPLVARDQLLTVPLITFVNAIYAPAVQPDQTLTPGLLDGVRAIYAPTLVPQPIGVTLPLLDGARAIYTPAVLGDQFVVLVLIDGARAIYEPSVVPLGGIQTVTVALLDGSRAIYTPLVARDQSLSVGLIDGARAIYQPTVRNLNTLTPGLIDGVRAIYAPVVSRDQVLTIPLITATQAIYDVTVTKVGGLLQTITPGLIDGSRAIYAATVQPELLVGPGLIDAGRAIYAPSLKSIRTIVVADIDGVRAIYEPALSIYSAPKTVTSPLIDAGRAIYAPSVIQGATPIVVPLIDMGRAIFDVSINQSAWQTFLCPFIDAGRAIYAPVLIKRWYIGGGTPGNTVLSDGPSANDMLIPGTSRSRVIRSGGG